MTNANYRNRDFGLAFAFKENGFESVAGARMLVLFPMFLLLVRRIDVYELRTALNVHVEM